MKELKETHQQGIISVENIPNGISSFILGQGGTPYFKGDFGIQVAKDGRVWICIDGIAFLRFKPEGMGFGTLIKDDPKIELDNKGIRRV